MSIKLNLTHNGIEYADSQEILSDIRSVWQSAFPNLDVNSIDTPQGQIIASQVEILESCRDSILNFTNCFFNGGLDNYENILGNILFGIQRQPATKCIVNAKVTGKPATKIPASFRAKSGDLEFENISGEVSINKNGFANIQMQCMQSGDKEILANTLTTIMTPVFGIETINNDANSTKGSNIENNLWERALNSQNFRSKALFASMLAKVKNVTGVSDCSGYDNSKTTQETYKNHVFPPHSIALVVEGGDIKDIAEAIYSAKNPGPELLGDVVYELIGEEEGQKYEMKFYRPTYVDLRAKIIVYLGELADQNYELLLQNELIRIIKENSINRDIFVDDKILELELPQGVRLVSLKMQKITDANFAEEFSAEDVIYLDFLEKAQIKQVNIEVSTYEPLKLIR